MRESTRSNLIVVFVLVFSLMVLGSAYFLIEGKSVMIEADDCPSCEAKTVWRVFRCSQVSEVSEVCRLSSVEFMSKEECESFVTMAASAQSKVIRECIRIEQ